MMNLILKICIKPAALQPLSCSGRCSDPRNSSWCHFWGYQTGGQAVPPCWAHVEYGPGCRRDGNGSCLSVLIPLCEIWEARLPASLLEPPWPAQCKGAQQRVKRPHLHIKVGATVKWLRWTPWVFYSFCQCKRSICPQFLNIFFIFASATYPMQINFLCPL